ncbi:hypothetical protein LQ567_11760 [Niabella pedocola]|uniref:Uncharacterized protein n=1 Tax=Niabella pedocola TaxID=1752077 RepID=A0ABS8PU45_9BACT|nr:hypothetical protein [Niabella pedocola]MCD2423441.1 hypothetical protein [Niabella pedocola]
MKISIPVDRVWKCCPTITPPSDPHRKDICDYYAGGTDLPEQNLETQKGLYA